MTSCSTVEAAQQFVGVPYHHQGRCTAGMDCVGLILAVAEAIGIKLNDKPEFRRFKRRPPVGDGLLIHLDDQCLKVQLPQPGDIMVFWFNPRNKRAQHLGIMGHGTLIHCHSGAKFVVEQHLTGYWWDRFIVAYRMPGVT